MRNTIIILCISAFQVFASGSYAQTKSLNLVMKDATIREVLQEIQSQSEFFFLYNSELIDVTRKVSISIENEKVDETLAQLFSKNEVDFLIKDRYIVLTPAGEKVELIIQRTITGKVTDSSGQPLPGVTVVVKGSTQGTVTNTEGDYSLSNVTEDAMLVFSFVGMRTQELLAGNNMVINVSLQEESIDLEEVVAVGYGTQKKINLTGSISSVNFEDVSFQSRPLTNVSSMLSGISSGVRIQQTNGMPNNNESANINIRGVGSLNIGSSPLILVDGQVASINSVSPNDVASVSVLKDAASAAIYGSRASNGVILITTKSGQDSGGKVTFNLNSYVGKKTPINVPDIIHNTVDFMELQNRIWLNSGTNPRWTADQIEEYRRGHEEDPFLWPYNNHFEEVTKENIVQKYHLSARGGNDRIGFYSSLEYYNDNGLVNQTGYRRINFRNNMNYQVNNWLKLGNNFTYINGISEPATAATIFEWMRGTTPAVFPRHADGRWGGGAFQDGTGGAVNPYMQAESARGESTSNQLQGKIFAELTPFKGLSITGSYFRDLRLNDAWSGNQPQDRWNFRTNEIVNDQTTGALLSMTNSNSKNQREIIDLYADYTYTLSEHSFHVLVGYNQEYFYDQSTSASKNGLFSYDTPVLNAASLNPQASGNADDFAMRSYFGRFNYNFAGKYMLEGNLRYDGSSRFSPENRWGIFPSVSGGWFISEENFWDPLRNVINGFKVRASWGVLGNAGIGDYEWQSFYSSAPYAKNNEIVSGLKYNTFGNTRISWESTEVINVGADITIVNNLNLNTNYYIKNTSDILTRPPIPGVMGGIGAPRVNTASVQNKGYEVEAVYRNNFGRFSFEVGANYSYNQNKITDYEDGLLEIRGYTAWKEDYPIGVFYVLEVDQIVQEQSMIDGMLADGYTFSPRAPKPGDFLYKNTNGDKEINMDDRVLKGNPIPVHMYGGNLNLGYAGFDFNVYFSGVAKWDKYLNNEVYSFYYTDNYQLPYEQMEMWSEDNRSTKIPKVYTNDHMNNQNHDAYLRKADYLKIRSIQFGYSLPANIINAINFSNVRAYVNAENPFTFTSWPAYDPEVESGVLHTYPLTTTISLGLNVSF